MHNSCYSRKGPLDGACLWVFLSSSSLCAQLRFHQIWPQAVKEKAQEVIKDAQAKGKDLLCSSKR